MNRALVCQASLSPLGCHAEQMDVEESYTDEFLKSWERTL